MGQGCLSREPLAELKVNAGMLEAFHAVASVQPRRCGTVASVQPCCGDNFKLATQCGLMDDCEVRPCWGEEAVFQEPLQPARSRSHVAGATVVLRPASADEAAAALHKVLRVPPMNPHLPSPSLPSQGLSRSRLEPMGLSRSEAFTLSEFSPRSWTTADSESSWETYTFEAAVSMSKTERPPSVPLLVMPTKAIPVRIEELPLLRGISTESTASTATRSSRPIGYVRPAKPTSLCAGSMTISRPCAPVLRKRSPRCSAVYEDEIYDFSCPDPEREVISNFGVHVDSLESVKEFLDWSDVDLESRSSWIGLEFTEAIYGMSTQSCDESERDPVFDDSFHNYSIVEPSGNSACECTPSSEASMCKDAPFSLDAQSPESIIDYVESSPDSPEEIFGVDLAKQSCEESPCEALFEDMHDAPDDKTSEIPDSEPCKPEIRIMYDESGRLFEDMHDASDDKPSEIPDCEPCKPEVRIMSAASDDSWDLSDCFPPAIEEVHAEARSQGNDLCSEALQSEASASQKEVPQSMSHFLQSREQEHTASSGKRASMGGA